MKDYGRERTQLLLDVSTAHAAKGVFECISDNLLTPHPLPLRLEVFPPQLLTAAVHLQGCWEISVGEGVLLLGGSHHAYLTVCLLGLRGESSSC